MRFWYLLLLIGLVYSIPAALAQTPKSAEDYNNRGVTRRGNGDIEGAIEDFTKAVSMKGPSMILAAAYNNRANALFSKNDVEGAIADYSKAIELQPTDYENYYNRGSVLLGKNSLNQFYKPKLTSKGLSPIIPKL
jgi:tetratricopeptide (TPR) repeat protein